MSEIILFKPDPGQRVVERDAGKARLVCKFSVEEATIVHVGEDLVFTFADGASIRICDYYNSSTDTSDSPPPLKMKGSVVPVAQLLPLERLKESLSVLQEEMPPPVIAGK